MITTETKTTHRIRQFFGEILKLKDGHPTTNIKNKLNLLQLSKIIVISAIHGRQKFLHILDIIIQSDDFAKLEPSYRALGRFAVIKHGSH
jgi:hypothetical protein